jgi:hypothetical protein
MRYCDFSKEHSVIQWLNQDDESKPGEALLSFFDMYSLPTAKFYLWELLSGFMDGRKEGFHIQCDGGQMLFFYEQLNSLIESAYLIRKKKKDKDAKRTSAK